MNIWAIAVEHKNKIKFMRDLDKTLLTWNRRSDARKFLRVVKAFQASRNPTARFSVVQLGIMEW